MAKYITMDLLKSLSGKVCSHSDSYFANRGKTQYTGKICYPRTSPYSQSELDQQNKFRIVSGAVKTRLADTSKQAADLAAWKAQKNQKKGYPTLRGYLFAIGYANFNASTSSVSWPN